MKKAKQIIFALVICGLGAVYAYGTWPDEIYDTAVNNASYGNVGEISQEDSVEQSFVCPQDGLYKLDVKLNNMGRPCEGIYDWELQEIEGNVTVAKGEIDASKMNNDDVYPLSFPRIKASKKVRYKLLISTNTLTSENGMTLMTTPKFDGKEDLLLNGKKTGQIGVIDLQMKYFSIETFVVFIGLLTYLVLFTKFLLKIFK